VADWKRPSDPLMAALALGLRAFDGFETTRANIEGRLPEFLADAGLGEVAAHGSLRTIYGSLGFFKRKATRSAAKALTSKRATVVLDAYTSSASPRRSHSPIQVI
jgi:hypothetical protein